MVERFVERLGTLTGDEWRQIGAVDRGSSNFYSEALQLVEKTIDLFGLKPTRAAKEYLHTVYTRINAISGSHDDATGHYSARNKAKAAARALLARGTHGFSDLAFNELFDAFASVIPLRMLEQP